MKVAIGMKHRGAVIAAPLSDRLSLANKLHALAGNLPELLAGVHVPLVAALLQKSQLSRLFDAHAGVAEWALAAMVAGAHACFWWRALRRRTGAPGFAAMVLMLYFYAAVAGILVARASLYGANYFWQPRYVILYQLSVVALVLMAIDAMVTVRGAGPQARGAPAMRVAGLAIAGAILLLQFKLSVATWGSVQASSRFQARLAGQIGALAIFAFATIFMSTVRFQRRLG